MTEVILKKQRPKHLALNQIRLPLPGFVSILHRVSGAGLFLMLPVLLALFGNSVGSPESYASYIRSSSLFCWACCGRTFTTSVRVSAFFCLICTRVSIFPLPVAAPESFWLSALFLPSRWESNYGKAHYRRCPLRLP